ncbi:hypothetical protein [Rhodovarius lipocyclicus]|uniref:hypothetical protein n=1 Tax=Rhodovarius lipocyclicus TaxID=268410 RepID=UPI00135BD549|nr:hypothetical protein [Rhodovarius lipocyclicus]
MNPAPPRLVVAAPLGGPAGARLRPMLRTLSGMLPVLFLTARRMDADLAPGPALTLDEWRGREDLAFLPHLHVLADDAAAEAALRAALFRPGHVLLADPGLARLYRAITAGQGRPAAWRRSAAEAHGPAARRLVGSALEPAALRLMPMLEAATAGALSLSLLHPGALPGLAPGHAARLLPPAFPEAPALSRAEARAALGLGEGPHVLLPMAGPARLRALRAAVTAADANPILPDSRGEEGSLSPIAADAVLALDLPLSAWDQPLLEQAMAAGTPILAWAEGPDAEHWPEPAVMRLGFAPVETAIAPVTAALRALLASPAPRGLAARQHAAAHGPHVLARRILDGIPGCRVMSPAP